MAEVYENHPNDSRVTGPLEVGPTVVSRFGTGGGNVPFVLERRCYSIREDVDCLTPWDVQSRRIYGEDGVWLALYAGDGGGKGYVLRGEL